MVLYEDGYPVDFTRGMATAWEVRRFHKRDMLIRLEMKTWMGTWIYTFQISRLQKICAPEKLHLVGHCIFDAVEPWFQADSS
jgi:hypothetical protein